MEIRKEWGLGVSRVYFDPWPDCCKKDACLLSRLSWLSQVPCALLCPCSWIPCCHILHGKLVWLQQSITNLPNSAIWTHQMLLFPHKDLPTPVIAILLAFLFSLPFLPRLINSSSPSKAAQVSETSGAPQGISETKSEATEWTSFLLFLSIVFLCGSLLSPMRSTSVPVCCSCSGKGQWNEQI